MSTTIATYVGNGSQTDFSFSFDYLRKEFVKVLVDGAEVPFTFHTPQTVKIEPAPATGKVIIIRRDTDRARLVTFVDGSVLLAGDLNVAQLQAIHIAAEALDAASGSLLIDQTGAYSAGFRRLANLGDPTEGRDAVTKEWAETSMTSTLGQANAAKAAAQAAEVDAEAAAAVSTTNANTAVTKAAEADASADLATDKAAEAATHAATALTRANTALTHANTAGTHATTATTQAGVATSKAAEAATYSEQVQGNIIPVGAVMDFPAGAIPTGWLACDGGQVSTLFPQLRNLLITAGNPFGSTGGNPLLPNMVGAVARNSRGVPDVEVIHQEAQGVTGGAGGAGIWNTRNLNTITRNLGNIASLSAAAVTVPAGTYYVEWESSAYYCSGHQTRLVDNAASPLIWGSSEYAQQNTSTTTKSVGSGIISLGEATALTLQHYTQSNHTIALGIASTAPGPEVYGTLRIWRVAPDSTINVVPCIKAYGIVDVTGQANLSALLTGIATVPEAEAGTDNTKLMTPTRTRSAVRAALNATSAAPIYAPRAWINFHSIPTAGTYSRAGNIVTVTMTNHGMSTGMRARLDFTTGTASDGLYEVTVTGANTFTVVDPVSGTTSGNVTRNIYIRASGNIADITYLGVGSYVVTFATPMEDANYAVLPSHGVAAAGGDNRSHIFVNGPQSAASCPIGSIFANVSYVNQHQITLTFLR